MALYRELAMMSWQSSVIESVIVADDLGRSAPLGIAHWTLKDWEGRITTEGQVERGGYTGDGGALTKVVERLEVRPLHQWLIIGTCHCKTGTPSVRKSKITLPYCTRETDLSIIEQWL